MRFLNGSDPQRAQVQQVAEQWAHHGNIRFIFGNDRDAEIRVAFNWNGDGTSWSAIGKDAKNPRHGADCPTMNFGWLNDRVILHEFGHALGFVHEHRRPDAGIPWDRPAAIRHFLANNPRWTRDDVERNVFTALDAVSLNSSEFDPYSIMAYPIPNSITIGDFEIPWNDALSDMDRRFTGTIYPFTWVNLEVQQGPAGKNIHQRWILEEIGGGRVLLKNVGCTKKLGGKRDMVLSYDRDDPSKRTFLSAREGDRGHESQQWRIKDIGGGRRLIENAEASDANGVSLALVYDDIGTPQRPRESVYLEAQRGEDGGNVHQRWALNDLGDGHYVIENPKRSASREETMVLTW